MSTRPLAEPQTRFAKHVEYTLRPDISLYKALHSCFVLDRITYTVGHCPDDVFRRFITECSQAVCPSRHWNRLNQQTLLSMLDEDSSDVARWYAIETLLAHHVRVPLKKDAVVK